MTSTVSSVAIQEQPGVSDPLEGISPAAYANRWRALAVIAVALLVISLDNTILNVALPSISRALNASAGDLQWIIDSYVLVFASLLLTMGAFSDRIGRRRALMIGVALFGLGSVACALSTTTSQLILARGFTGIGGAIIMPSTLSIISATFPRAERARAFAIWAAIFGLGVGIGPITGGALLKFFAWESVFLVNIPVVVFALIGTALYISESRDDTAPRPDIPGVLLSISGLFALIYGIIGAGEHGWGDPSILASFGIAAVLLTLFILWELRTPNAMLPMRFFRNPSFTIANIALVMMTFSLFGLTFFQTQFFQSVLGYEPVVAGAAALPVAITLMIGGVNSARVASRIGTKKTVALGSLLVTAALTYYAFIFSPTTSYLLLVIGQVTFAAGISLVVSPATNSIMQSIPVRKSGIGSAMNDMTRQLGGALGIAVLGTILNTIYRGSVEPLVNALPPTFPEAGREAILSSIQGAHLVAEQIPDDFASLAQQIIDVSNAGFLDGVRQALLLGAAVTLVSAIIAYRLLPAVVRRSSE
ncbi:MAG: MFS transporter [Chloroflexi bacterium]|nr:MFS transporter [Chloroflexota bacterium]